jgi:hypothetical protein
MARDPLDQFRRPQQQPQAQRPPQSPPVPPVEGEELEPPRQFDPRTGKEIYQAFRISLRKRDRLEIRPEAGPWLFPRYFDMRDMIVNRRAGTEIVLPYPAYEVFIEGRHLQQLVYALKESRCDFIEAYDPNTHAPVMESDAPFIQSIRVVPKSRQSEGEPPRRVERQGA